MTWTGARGCVLRVEKNSLSLSRKKKIESNSSKETKKETLHRNCYTVRGDPAVVQEETHHRNCYTVSLAKVKGRFSKLRSVELRGNMYAWIEAMGRVRVSVDRGDVNVCLEEIRLKRMVTSLVARPGRKRVFSENKTKNLLLSEGSMIILMLRGPKNIHKLSELQEHFQEKERQYAELQEHVCFTPSSYVWTTILATLHALCLMIWIRPQVFNSPKDSNGGNTIGDAGYFI
ncbi:Uncharacterized protein Rs2_51658 [Raphanus sativus]|nr:Uncharacterized protein Rs2_51658 [Raphanus sativus]